MNNLHYNGASLWTGSAIATGVLALAAAVITAGGTSKVTIPVRTASAEIVATELILGPGTEMVAVDLGPGPGEITDNALVQTLADATEWWQRRTSTTSDGLAVQTRSDDPSTRTMSDA